MVQGQLIFSFSEMGVKPTLSSTGQFTSARMLVFTLDVTLKKASMRKYWRPSHNEEIFKLHFCQHFCSESRKE
jgi:hypothetical protein